MDLSIVIPVFNEAPTLETLLRRVVGVTWGNIQTEIILVDETYVYDIVELRGDLDIATYYASSLDMSWIPEPYPHPTRRGMIASADSDLPPKKIPFLKQKGAIAAAIATRTMP